MSSPGLLYFGTSSRDDLLSGIIEIANTYIALFPMHRIKLVHRNNGIMVQINPPGRQMRYRWIGFQATDATSECRTVSIPDVWDRLLELVAYFGLRFGQHSLVILRDGIAYTPIATLRSYHLVFDRHTLTHSGSDSNEPIPEWLSDEDALRAIQTDPNWRTTYDITDPAFCRVLFMNFWYESQPLESVSVIDVLSRFRLSVQLPIELSDFIVILQGLERDHQQFSVILQDPDALTYALRPRSLQRIQDIITAYGFDHDDFQFFRQRVPHPDLDIPGDLVELPFIEEIVESNVRVVSLLEQIDIPYCVVRIIECALLIRFFRQNMMFGDHLTFRSIELRNIFTDDNGIKAMDFARFQRLIDIIKRFDPDFRRLIRNDNFGYRGAGRIWT